MKNKLYYIAIAIIILIAILIRGYNWPNVINDINCDEAMTVINANAIAKQGIDIYGTTYPVYFESWLYGGQSAFATYIIALFIKLFGFSTVVVRLPILLISVIGILFAVLLVNKIFKNKVLNLIILALLAINPWHILQSQWILDCNFFPHIMIIATYFLLVGIDEQKDILLYVSMFLFALTLYTYGVALYLIPIFLLIMGAYLLINNRISLHKLILCALVFFIVAMPIILMTVINLFDLPTISIGKLTIQNFEYVTRNNDMLIFSDNKIQTLFDNISSLVKILFFQEDGLIWNSFPKFGTIYLISLPIVIFGIVTTCIENMQGKADEQESKNGIMILVAWTIVSLACGILINGININRINVIWYILIIWNAIGIYQAIKLVKYKAIPIILFIVLYLINFIGFVTYYKTGTLEISNSYTWSRGLVSAVEYVNNLEQNDKIILSYNVCNTDKEDVFIRYGAKGGQIEENINKQEFFKYYLPVKRGTMNFSTESKVYIIETINEDYILTEQIYLLEKSEYEKIKNNIEGYEIKEFNNYIVIIKK